MNKDMTMLNEIARFFRINRVQWFLLPIGILIIIFVHECLHAIAILAQGGKIAEFHWQAWPIPSGFVRQSFDPSIPFSGKLISAFPHIAWCLLCLVAFAVSFHPKPLRPILSSTVFFWLYLIPLADLGNAAASQMRGVPDADLSRVLGPPSPVTVAGLVLLGLSLAVIGFFTQKRLYRENALSPIPYSLLGSLALILIAGAPIIFNDLLNPQFARIFP